MPCGQITRKNIELKKIMTKLNFDNVFRASKHRFSILLKTQAVRLVMLFNLEKKANILSQLGHAYNISSIFW